MSQLLEIHGEDWYQFLEPVAQEFVSQSYTLLHREERLGTTYNDYSFIVFPMAKAYEGFIKQYLHSVGIIRRPDYSDTKFRIGRALNPDISDRHKDEWWLYDDVERACGKEVARSMWDAWIECRNHVFHYYLQHEMFLTLDQTRKKLEQMRRAMSLALECARK